MRGTSLRLLAVLAGTQVACLRVPAALFYCWTGSQPIPDDSKLGEAFSFTFAGRGTAVADFRVGLNISGGWNGDFYRYLSHGPRAAALLNRVGVGQSTPAASAEGYGQGGFTNTVSSGGCPLL